MAPSRLTRFLGDGFFSLLIDTAVTGPGPEVTIDPVPGSPIHRGNFPSPGVRLS